MQKPALKIPLNMVDWFLELVAIGVLLCLFLFPAWTYTALPDTIPIHFNINGKVDGYGAKFTIWILPVVTLVVYSVLTIIQQFPNRINYWIDITDENAERQYRNVLYMLRTLKFIVLVVLFVLTLAVIQSALNEVSKINAWFLPLTLTTILGSITIFLARSYHLR